MTLSQPHELTWGALVLDSEVDTDVPWTCETLSEGTNLGNPVPLVEVVRSMLSDGSIGVVTGYDNREFPVRIRLNAPDGQAMAQAEAAFMAEVLAARPAPLVWTPPMVAAWPVVLDVVHVRLDRDYDAGAAWDHRERFSQQRVYELTFTTLPWVRDLTLNTIPALPVPVNPDVPATTVDIDTCDSQQGWSRIVWPEAAWSALTLTATAGYVEATGTVVAGDSQASISLVRTGAVNMGDTPYLVADVYPANTDGDPSRIDALFDGSSTSVPPVAVLATSTPNVLRYYFEAPAAFGSVRFRRVIDRPETGGDARSIRVYNVARTDRIEISGSRGFQIARTALVDGSAPTQAAIRLDSAAAPLIGSTALLYTGASPVVPLRRLRTSSATVNVDDTKISGAYNDLSVPMVFRVPIEQLEHSTYALLARLQATGSLTVNWQARIVASDGTAIPGSDLVVSGAALVKNTSADPWRIHDLAAIQLPPVSIEGSTTHAVEITISMSSGGAAVNVDEAWLCDSDNGAVTLVHEPSAFQLSAIELRSPELDAPRPAVIGTWLGYGTQDITRLSVPGTHLLKPGLLHVFTATDLARYAPCTLHYFPRYHSHPGPPLPSEQETG